MFQKGLKEFVVTYLFGDFYRIIMAIGLLSLVFVLILSSYGIKHGFRPVFIPKQRGMILISCGMEGEDC